VPAPPWLARRPRSCLALKVAQAAPDTDAVGGNAVLKTHSDLDHRGTLGMTSAGATIRFSTPGREEWEAGDTATRPDPSPSGAIA
jgi:hypothetical protein